MSKLVWDQTGERLYETGVKNGVLYVQEAGAYTKGVAWNGLTAVTESPSGAEANPFYADGIKYLNIMSAEEFGGTIEAYMYPDEFKACNGEGELIQGVTIGQQARKAFGLCYRTTLGNDTDGNEHGYKIHLVYGAQASVSEKAYSSINESPEPITFSWEFTTTPVEVTVSSPGEVHKPTSILTIDSTKVSDPSLMKALEDILYGTETNEARLPLPGEVFDIFTGA